MGDGPGALGGVSGAPDDDHVNVLVVGDDVSHLETTRQLLEREAGNWTYQCEIATSGAAALELLEAEDSSVDCVVSAFEMPRVDGLTLLSEIRERGFDIPFILYTDHGSESVASEAMSAGATDYVPRNGPAAITVLRKRIESAVGRYRAEVERDLRSRAIEAVGEGIAIIDEDGRFADVNRAYAEMYGYDREELVGSSWERVNPPDENERMYLQILPTVEADGEWSGESVGQRADGTTFAKSKSFTRLDAGGFVCAVRDITAQKEQEQRLREQNERLREFARLVSHDLRNPLNVAGGYLSLLAEDVDSDHVERITSAHDRMRQLIDDMLSLAREGRVVDSPRPVALQDVVEEAAATTGLETDGTLVVDSLPRVMADESRLGALFENLFGNALTHAGPSPTVRVGRTADGFFVEDDGPGIPEGERVTVFKSGYTTESDGTGFGLAIVERIADAHKWTVSIRDGIDGGTRFEFRGVELLEGTEDTGEGPRDEDAGEAQRVDTDGGERTEHVGEP